MPTAALLQAHVAALDRHSAALEAHAAALLAVAAAGAAPVAGASAASAASAALAATAPAAVAPAASAVGASTAPAAAAGATAAEPPLLCPPPLEPLRRMLEGALRRAGGQPVQARSVLLDARVGLAAPAWAQLRALAAAYHPEAAVAGLLQGLEMEGSAARGPEWARAGAGQLATVVVSGGNAATVLSHASRHVARQPAGPARQRLAARLLADAVALRA